MNLGCQCTGAHIAGEQVFHVFDEWNRCRLAVGESCAQKDVPCHSEHSKHFDGLPPRLVITVELQKTIDQRRSSAFIGAPVLFDSDASLDQMSAEVSDVETRITPRVKVMVDDEHAIAVDEHLVGIKIAVDSDWRDGNDLSRELEALVNYPSNSLT